jgi:DNA polymerase-3 subunit alpha
MEAAKVIKVTSLGRSETIDLEVDCPDHQFLAGGVLVSNSHAVAYSYIAYVCQYLKTLYPLEWWTSVLQNSDADDLRENARFCATLVHKPDVNLSDLDFFVAALAEGGDPGEGRIIYPLRMVRSVAGAAEAIIEARNSGGPFLGMEDFYNRVNRSRVHVGVVINLIYAGAFDNLFNSTQITDRNSMVEVYGRLRGDLAHNRYIRKTRLELMNFQAKVLPLWAPDYVSYIRERTPMSVSCPSIINELSPGSTTIIGGIVRAVKHITTKKGDPMCFVTLGNRNEIADVTVFPDLYSAAQEGTDARHADLLKEEEVLFVSGKVNEYNERRSLVADQIWYFTDRDAETGAAPNPMDQIDESHLLDPSHPDYPDYQNAIITTQ